MQKSLFHDLKNLGEYLKLKYETLKKTMSLKKSPKISKKTKKKCAHWRIAQVMQ